jgi:signal transduction histidine kinase/ActR/RegA family two-component response regulator
MYRDWRVLITASVIVGIDHFLRGAFFPASVYGILTPSPWRWIEHVTWVIFEDTFLIVAISQSLRELRAIANRQIALEDASRRAESADRAKGAFLAHMSHEIRTPMTAILGYADMMTLDADSRRTEAVDAIRRNGRHLLAVLDDILDLSKIEADQLRVEHAPTDVSELLRDIQHLMGPRALQRNTSVSLEIRNLPPTLLTDVVRLRQIVLNLASNAVKFTTDGQVSILAEYAPADGDTGTLSVSVTDTGIGLTPEQQDRLFKPFSQADDGHHRVYGGTGLGLVISQRLAALLGGQIRVQSTPGTGSTFRLEVPAQVSTRPVVRENRPRMTESVPRTAAAGKRVLIVDDVADNRRLLRKLLLASGFEVDVADDGRAGVTAAIAALNDHHPFDVILMDMLMPALDGYEATRELRERGYRGLIVALTAYATDEQKCKQAGCDDFVAKPFDCEQLVMRILTLTQKAREDHPEPAATST